MSRNTVRRTLATAFAATLATGGLVLTTTPAAVAAPTEVTGVTFQWSGSAELQKAPPFGGGNPFSAGISDGTQAQYKAADGNVSIVHVNKTTAAETTPTWATRNASAATNATVDQIVRFGNGSGTVDADGSGTVGWDGDWSINFYGGLVPFTLSDPVLTVSASGTGTLTADLVGYASDQDNPMVKNPLPPVPDVTVATFSGVDLSPTGAVTVSPDYEGVQVDTGESTPQNRTAAGWGAWPQAFVDFHLDSGLSSYWYSSGGTSDPLKPPADFTVTQRPSLSLDKTVFDPTTGVGTVTVTGSGFLPHLSQATRQPVCAAFGPACGKSGGFYVAFGKVAEAWQPSTGAAGTTRSVVSSNVDLTKWANPASNGYIAPGGANVVLGNDGTFTATLSVDKATIDALASAPNNVKYGVIAYPASGGVTALGEVYAPITFDSADPVVALTGPGTVEAGTSADFTVAVEDASATTVEYRLTNGEWVSVTDNAFSISDLAIGSHTVEVRATDAVGRTGTDSVEVEVEDTTNPVVTVTGPTAVVEGADATYTVAVTDASEIESVEYRPTNGEWVAVTGGTFTLSDLEVGSYSYEVRATDASENTGTTTVDLDVTVAAPPFTDVAGNTFASEIAWLSTKGITTGYANGNGTFSFQPSGSVLREQMAAFLYRYVNDGTNPGANAPGATFTDVPASHVFSKHIKWLADEKITTGYAGNVFRPGQPVLREQMAAFLYRVAGEPGFTAPATSPFADVPTSHTFYKEITWLASTKVTTGYTEGGVTTFKGSQPVLREQMAAFLFRFDNLER